MLRLMFLMTSFLSTQLRARFASERGASMVEYGLLVGLIAVAVITALTALGGDITGIFEDASTELQGVGSDGSG